MSKIKINKRVQNIIEDSFLFNLELQLKMYSNSIKYEDQNKISTINYILINVFQPILPKNRIFKAKDDLFNKYYSQKSMDFLNNGQNLVKILPLEERLKVEESIIFDKKNLFLLKTLFPLFILVDSKYFEIFLKLFEEKNKNNRFPIFLKNLYSNYMQNVSKL